MNLVRIFKKNPEYLGAIAVVTLLVTIPMISKAMGQVNVEGLQGINEDDVIICVNNSDGIEDNGFICHIYDTDSVDWYQDAYDGTFFNESDSFNVNPVD